MELDGKNRNALASPLPVDTGLLDVRDGCARNPLHLGAMH